MDLLSFTLDPILRLFAPTSCAGCGEAPGPLCPSCELSLRARRLRAEPAGGLRPLTIWLGDYEGPLRGLLHASKFQRLSTHSRWLASRMADHLAHYPGLLATSDALVLPPVEPDRREFHPAWALAREIGIRLDRPVLPDLIRRRGRGRARHLAGRARGDHVSRTLHANRPIPAEIRRVALVDDLWTTGATARRVTSLLARQGVEVVLWVFLARTPRRRRRCTPRIPGQGHPHLSGRKKSGPHRASENRSRSLSQPLPSLDGDASSW